MIITLQPSLDQLFTEVSSNHPERVRIERSDFGQQVGYGAQLGQALLSNTVVSELTLCCNDLLGRIEDADDVEPLVQDFAPLLEYLRTSSSLQAVIFDESTRRDHIESSRTMENLSLQAIAANQSIVSVSMTTFCRTHVWVQLLQRAPQLQRIMWNVDGRITDADDAREEQARADLARAIGGHPNLKGIALVYAGPDSEGLVDAILSPLLSASSSVKSIKIRPEGRMVFPPPMPFYPILAALWQSPTANVQEIELQGRRMDPDFWGALKGTLECKTDKHRSLILVDCPFDEVTSESFATLISSLSHDQSGTGGNVDLSIRHESTVDRPLLDWLTNSQHVSSLLTAPTRSVIQTSTVHMNVDELGQLQAISSSLPRSVSIRNFQIKLFHPIYDLNPTDPDQQLRDANVPAEFFHTSFMLWPLILLNGIKRNGSLTQLDVRDFYPAQRLPFFTEHMNRLLQAYLERNRRLPELLSRSLVNAVDTDLSADPHSVSITLLYPLLFSATTDMSQMAPTHLLRGLQNLEGDRVGPMSRSPKRCINK